MLNHRIRSLAASSGRSVKAPPLALIIRSSALVVSAGAGAVLAYFFDPDRGRSRRAQSADRLAGLSRRSRDRLGRGVRRVRATATGFGSRLAHRRWTETEQPDDVTLAHKVETELFRDPTVPKGRMNVNAENGTVVLRGVANSRDQIERIILATMAIDGVRGVQSLLRTPDELPERERKPKGKRPDEPDGQGAGSGMTSSRLG
jgi:hypothetical protein